MNVLSNRELTNRAYVFNTDTPNTTVDILTTAITVIGSAHRYLRVYACFSVAVKLEVKTTVGAATVTELLNGGTDLVKLRSSLRSGRPNHKSVCS
jgi:hypothetical protein